MKIKNGPMILIGGVALLAGCKKSGEIAPVVSPQTNVVSHASNFTSVEYFDPPNQLQMKFRLAGAEAQPLAGGLLLIRQFHLETFDSNGTPGLVVKAPHCVYDTQRGVASSAGHLRLETADGSSHVEGDGFLWRQTNSFLTISNNVKTVIEKPPEKKTGP
jgi:hypothetical protein